MKSYRVLLYGLISLILLVITLFIRRECDPEPATRTWRRLTQQTTVVHTIVDSVTSYANRARPIRVKARTNPKETTGREFDIPSQGTSTGNDAGLTVGSRKSSADTVWGQGSNFTSEWAGSVGIDELNLEIGSSAGSEGEDVSAPPYGGATREYYPEEPKMRTGFYGVPVNGQNYVVIYNAVPKTGSRAFFGAIRKALNASTLTEHIGSQNIRRKDRHSRKGFASFIYNVTSPQVLRGHVPFMELPSRFLYINIIRDPLERLISEYYFMRNGDSRIPAASSQRSHGYKPNHLPEGWNDTLDECVMKGSRLCSPGSGMLRLFCGFDIGCSSPSKWTFDQAVANLDRYTMVGLTDDFEGSLDILERLLPDMTGHVATVFRNNNHTLSKYKTNNRQQPLDSTKKALRDLMSYEYEFYDLVRDKFYKLKASLGIS